jgi:hypothetical protein
VEAENGGAWATILDHRAYLHSRLAELEKLYALVSDFDEQPRLSAAVARVGWGWAADLEGAAGFLRARPMVTDPA